MGVTPGSPNSRQYGKHIFDIAPRAVERGMLEVSPYWKHAISLKILENAPMWAFEKLVVNALERKKIVIAKSVNEV